MTQQTVASLEVGAETGRMLPAVAYTSDEVLAWERRHLYAGSWTCLGRSDELLPAEPHEAQRTGGGKPVTQQAVAVGDVPGLLVRDGSGLRMFANTCRHRGHELLPAGGTSQRRSITCPYHAWSYDLSGALIAAPGFRDVPGFEPVEHALVELPVTEWGGWLFGHALHPAGSPEVPAFTTHLGELERDPRAVPPGGGWSWGRGTPTRSRRTGRSSPRTTTSATTAH